MKKINFIIILCMLVFITGCNNAANEQPEKQTEATTEITTEMSDIKAAQLEMLQEQSGVYIQFGQNGTEASPKIVDAYDENTNEDIQIWQISPEYYIRFFEDELANVELRYTYAYISMAIPYENNYLDSIGISNTENDISNLAIYEYREFKNGTYKYVKLTTVPDIDCNILKFYPNYAGKYIIGSKINNKSSETLKQSISNTELVNIDERYDRIYKENIDGNTYSILIDGIATVEVYSQTDELIATYTNTMPISEIQEYAEKEIVATVGDNSSGVFNQDAITIQTSRKSKYYYKVIPESDCYVTTLSATYHNITTDSKDITKWVLLDLDENVEILTDNEKIDEEKIYKFLKE